MARRQAFITFLLVGLMEVRAAVEIEGLLHDRDYYDYTLSNYVDIALQYFQVLSFVFQIKVLRFSHMHLHNNSPSQALLHPFAAICKRAAVRTIATGVEDTCIGICVSFPKVIQSTDRVRRVRRSNSRTGRNAVPIWTVNGDHCHMDKPA